MNDYYNQNEEEEEEDDNKGPVTKDIVLFVVDYALHGSELFTEIIQSIQRFYQYKAISSRHDYVGLVFYGCQTFANRYNFPNIHVMHSLEPVSVERVLDLDRVLAEYPSNTSELGASAAEDQLLPLANVLQVCLDVFITAGMRQGAKRLMLFTNNDDPNAGNPFFFTATTSRLKDMISQHVHVEIFGFDSQLGQFDFEKFYAGALPEPKAADEAAPFRRIGAFEELSSAMRKRQTSKRIFAKLPWRLVGDVKLAVHVYIMYNETKRPHYGLVNARTNEMAEPESRYIVKNLQPPAKHPDAEVPESQLLHCFEYGGDKVIFTAAEALTIKSLIPEPGLTLLGFKPIARLKPHHNIKHSYFFYPDDSQIEGSSQLFSALLLQMHSMGVFAVCVMKARNASQPRLIALLPQFEDVDEAGLQVKPPGMNGIVLPWADDIRDPPQTSLVSVEEDVLDAAEGIVENLTMDDPFSSHHYQNPSLQLFYNNIEALALGRIKTDNIQDKTLPNLERFSDLSDSFDQLKLLVSNGLSTALPSPKTKKARKVSDGSAEVLGNDAGKQQFDLDDLRAMKQAGTLGKKLKVAELKEILQEMFSVSSSELKGLKKNDLVEKLMEKL